MESINIQNNTSLDVLRIGESANWKFGLITREVFRVSENEFEINDLSHGWSTALVNKNTMQKLLNGEESLLNIEFN